MVIFSYLWQAFLSAVRFVLSYRRINRLHEQARYLSISITGLVDDAPVKLLDEQASLVSLNHDAHAQTIKALLLSKVNVDFAVVCQVAAELRVLKHTPASVRINLNTTFEITFAATHTDVLACTTVTVPGDRDGKLVYSRFSCNLLKIEALEAAFGSSCRTLTEQHVRRLCSEEPWHRFRIAVLLGLLQAQEQASLREEDLKAYEKLRTRITEG